MSAGQKVTATAGPRHGQRGRIVEPIGVHESWVRWGRDDVTIYQHRSLALTGAAQ